MGVCSLGMNLDETPKDDGTTDLTHEDDKQATDTASAGSLPRDVSSKSLSEVVCFDSSLYCGYANRV